MNLFKLYCKCFGHNFQEDGEVQDMHVVKIVSGGNTYGCLIGEEVSQPMKCSQCGERNYTAAFDGVDQSLSMEEEELSFGEDNWDRRTAEAMRNSIKPSSDSGPERFDYKGYFFEDKFKASPTSGGNQSIIEKRDKIKWQGVVGDILYRLREDEEIVIGWSDKSMAMIQFTVRLKGDVKNLSAYSIETMVGDIRYSELFEMLDALNEPKK